MSKQEKTSADGEVQRAEVAELNKAMVKKDNKITDLEQRLTRLEKRLKSNERFGRTLATTLTTQVVAIDAVNEVLTRGLLQDAKVHDVLLAAIKEYDNRKVQRWLSGFFGVLFKLLALALAAFVGAFIYWVFSGQ